MLWPVLLPADIINCVAAIRIDQPSENYSQTVVIRDPGRYEKGGTRDSQSDVKRNGKDRGMKFISIFVERFPVVVDQMKVNGSV